MRRSMTAATLMTVLALAACGSDEPEVEAAPDPVDDVVSEPAGFDTLDADGDSYLDVDEIPETADRGAFEQWDADADSEIDADEINGNAFALWDADANGTISATEWKSSTDLWFPDTVQVVPLEDWDLDGDSEIDADEFAEQFDYSTLGESWSNGVLDEARFKTAYFELYDSDDDGKVSEAEFTAGLALLGGPTDT